MSELVRDPKSSESFFDKLAFAGTLFTALTLPSLSSCTRADAPAPAASADDADGPALNEAIAEALKSSGGGKLQVFDVYRLAEDAAQGRLAPAQRNLVPELAERLSDPDPSMRIAAALALQKIDPTDERGLPVLLDQMRGDAAGEAASALGKIGPKAALAVPALTEALTHQHAEIRIEAALALERIDPRCGKGLPALIAELEGAQQRWLKAAWESGLWSPFREEAAKEHRVFQQAAAALEQLGPAAKPAVPALVKALEHEWLIHSAVRPLTAMGPDAKDAVPALIAVLGNLDATADDYESAALALAAIGPEDKPALPAINRLLQQPYPEIRDSLLKAREKIER